MWGSLPWEPPDLQVSPGVLYDVHYPAPTHFCGPLSEQAVHVRLHRFLRRPSPLFYEHEHSTLFIAQLWHFFRYEIDLVICEIILRLVWVLSSGQLSVYFNMVFCRRVLCSRKPCRLVEHVAQKLPAGRLSYGVDTT